MVHCCVLGCKSRSERKYENITFHSFPKEMNIRKIWIESTGRQNWKPLKNTKMCSLHFEQHCFRKTRSMTFVNKNSTPTLYIHDGISERFDLNEGDENSENYDLEMQPDGQLNEIGGDVENSDLGEDDENDDLEMQPQTQQSVRESVNDVRCKCCLDNGNLHGLWEQSVAGATREVYGVMLIECFGLSWKRPEYPQGCADRICEGCIARLRAAVAFKKEVLTCERLLSSEQLNNEKLNTYKYKQEQDGDVSLEKEDFIYVTVDNADANVCQEPDVKAEECPTSKRLQITLVKEETCKKRQINVAHRKKRLNAGGVSDPGSSRPMPKRFKLAKTDNSGESIKDGEELSSSVLKCLDEQRHDLDNLEEGLKRSIQHVYLNKMSAAEASAACNVPRELIDKEVRKTTKVFDDDVTELKSRVKKRIKQETKTNLSTGKKSEYTIDNSENRLAEMNKQANNIAIIFECTNATPIRRHGGIGYGCCFCGEEYPEPADLKQHTLEKHDIKTKRNYAKGKKPSAYLVKLDITGLECVICGSTIDTLESLYDHLIEIHKKLLYRNAKNYIVPFKFDQEELKCVYCEFICNSFKGLLEHMNVHYRNHVCDICDAGFLTKNSLFNHATRHKKGTFKCAHCPKVFDTSSKRGSHQRLVHSSGKGVNRCGYCGEMFGTYRRKEKHLIDQHGVVLKKLKCKACDKTFETQTGLRIHTKRDHLYERRFKCSVCDKRCFTNVQLMQHTLKHTGVKKFQCTVCLKAYGRKSTLREHMRIHENDKRFKCDLCGTTFVQKCSWRGHMLSKHGQQV